MCVARNEMNVVVVVVVERNIIAHDVLFFTAEVEVEVLDRHDGWGITRSVSSIVAFEKTKSI